MTGNLPEKREEFIQALLDDDAAHLTPNASEHLAAAVQEYAEKLFREAAGIESLEHTGDGGPEITAAHVEEASWVLIRRLRRRLRHGGWIAFLRFLQALSVAFVGYGLSDLSTGLGAGSFGGGVIVGALALVIEQNLAREG